MIVRVAKRLSPLAANRSSAPTRVIECRRCGASLQAPNTDCRYCGPTDSVTLEFGA